MLVSQGSGVTLWILYGTAVRSAPIIVSNAVTLVLVLLLAYVKAHRGVEARSEESPDKV